MRRYRLSKRCFEELFEAVCRTYESIALSLGEQVIRHQAQQYFGFGKIDPTVLTLKKLVDLHPEVQNYLQETGRTATPSGKYLYNLDRQFQELQKPYDSVEVDFAYIDLYVCFLNPVEYAGSGQDITVLPDSYRPDQHGWYRKFEDFLNDVYFSPFEVKVQRYFMDPKTEGEVIPELATTYEAFYYYYRKNSIFSLTVTVDFINGSNGHYPIKITNLHLQEPNGVDDRVYKGTARQLTSCLSAQLYEKQNDLPLFMIAYTSHYRAQDMPIIHASLQGIATNGHPTASEIVLIKRQEGDRIIPYPGDLDNLKYYLWIQRRYFRVPPRIISDLKFLEARKIDTQDLYDLSGHYRIWTSGRHRHIETQYILQSYFWISSDYGAQFKTDRLRSKHDKQVAVMSISHFQGKKLCLSTHPEKGISVINFVIMDIPKNRDDHIGHGVYCTTGANGRMRAEPFVYRREDEEVPVQYFSRKDIRQLQQGTLQSLYKELLLVLGRQHAFLHEFLSDDGGLSSNPH